MRITRTEVYPLFDENHRYGLVKVSALGYETCNDKCCNPSRTNRKQSSSNKDRE